MGVYGCVWMFMDVYGVYGCLWVFMDDFQLILGVVIGKTDIRSFPDRKSQYILNLYIVNPISI